MKEWLLITALLISPALVVADPAPEGLVEAEVMRVLDEFMASFNAMNMKAHAGTYHFPHYRLAGGRMTIMADAEQLLQREPGLRELLAAIGWHHSAWDRRIISMRSNEKVHVDTRFTRYRADGSVIGSYDSLYVLTLENGRWAIKLRSSFAG